MAFPVDVFPEAQGCYLQSRAGGGSALRGAAEPSHWRNLTPAPHDLCWGGRPSCLG